MNVFRRGSFDVDHERMIFGVEKNHGYCLLIRMKERSVFQRSALIGPEYFYPHRIFRNEFAKIILK